MDSNWPGEKTAETDFLEQQFRAPPIHPPEYYRISNPRYQGLAAEKGYDQSYARIEKTKYSHEAMIDYLIAHPRVTQKEISLAFGYTEPWISRIFGSDSFQAALAIRREELTDPALVASIDERLRGMAIQSMEIITNKLGNHPDAVGKDTNLAVKALEISTKALGFGARQTPNVAVNNYVVHLPPKSPNAEAWREAHAPPMLEARSTRSTVDRDPTEPLSPMNIEES